ncbi:MAG: hypothetical protein WCG75_07770 [Armatimonadota bacterium]
MELREPDRAGRINIGKEYSGKIFAIQHLANGDIVLSPMVVRHEREDWLFQNPEALDSVMRGIEQSAAGKTKSLGSFAKYAADEK